MRIRFNFMLMLAALMAGTTVAFAAPALADSCPVGSDSCTVSPGTPTPAGLVTVSVAAGNVITVVIAPLKTNTLVFGLPFSYPPGPPCSPAYCRTSVDTGAAGIVNIDTVVIPPGPPSRFSLPNLVVVSLHPPGPCRVAVSGNTVIFTPVFPPGPPT